MRTTPGFERNFSALRIVASEITDTRTVEALLNQHNRKFEVVRDSMASAAAREQFQTLSRRYQWHRLPMIFEGDAFIGGEPELRAHLGRERSVDPMTLILTLLGLIPFVAGTAASMFASGGWMASLLPYYGWIILSFMAGTLWGASENAPGIRLASVVFALVACLGLVFLGPLLTPLALGVLFLALLPLDYQLMRRGLVSAGYWRLRRAVTAVVVICQAVLMAWIHAS